MTPAATIAGTLRILADLSEIRGAATETTDLRRAAHAIDAMPPRAAAALVQRARRDRLKDEPGIAPSVHWRLREIAHDGTDIAVSAALAGLPLLFKRLLESHALSTSDAVTFMRQVGALTIAELLLALNDGRVQQFGGDAVEGRLRQSAGALQAETVLIPLGRARDLLDSFVADMRTAVPSLDLITPAGDVRRFESLVSWLAVVARAADPASAIDALCAMRCVEEVRHRSGRRAILAVHHAEIDVRVAAPDEYGTVLFSATGVGAHVHAMQRRAGRGRFAAREEELYAQAGLPWIPPEMRQGTGEIEAAVAGALPVLISAEHIRGDLHMHTIYSDGADTLDAMVAACSALGYEYMAITDHSERASASRTLSRGDLSRQRDEIAALRERYPRIAILHGIEADIMPDGSLDFPDRILERLDIVLASLHDSARHDAKTLTRRCLQAIGHPLVSIVTHPANRLVGRRTGYPMDFDAIYAAAAETGTALEVDGAPSHLDLDGEHARAAIAAGVTLTIDSDCHRARLLARQMELGIGTARRGWVEPRHVLNARPLEEVRAFIAGKRRGR